MGGKICYNYIIRKSDISYRNICLYCDFKMFEKIYDICSEDFIINWGGSSGNVLKYKKKFPVYSELPVYFVTRKKYD